MNKSDVSVKYYTLKTFQNFENFLIPLLLFFAPVKGILITVGAFILLDTFTGIWKAKKKKIPITSKGFSAIISKMFLYEVTVLITYCLDVFIIGDILHGIFSIENLITKVVALVLVFIEMKSINENYEAVKGVNLWKEFKLLVSRTKEIKDDLTTMTKDKDEEN